MHIKNFDFVNDFVVGTYPVRRQLKIRAVSIKLAVDFVNCCGCLLRSLHCHTGSVTNSEVVVVS